MAILIHTPILFKKFIGCAFWPFIFVKRVGLKEDAVFINHERIHLRQQIELLIIPFYLWYFTEYLIHLIYLKSRHAAYHAISFEKEAYAKERDFEYLKNRQFWGFLKYLN